MCLIYMCPLHTPLKISAGDEEEGELNKQFLDNPFVLSDPPLRVKIIEGLGEIGEEGVEELRERNNLFNRALIKLERYKRELEELPIIKCSDFTQCHLNDTTRHLPPKDLDKDSKQRIQRLLSCNSHLKPCLIKYMTNSPAPCKQISDYLKSSDCISKLSAHLRERHETLNIQSFLTAPKWKNPHMVSEDIEQYRGKKIDCCYHNGACNAQNDCKCFKEKKTCEEYCWCNMDCGNKFPGCLCFGEC